MNQKDQVEGNLEGGSRPTTDQIEEKAIILAQRSRIPETWNITSQILKDFANGKGEDLSGRKSYPGYTSEDFQTLLERVAELSGNQIEE